MVGKPGKSMARAARVMQLGAGLAGSYLAYQLQRPFLDESEKKARGQSWRSKNARQVREELQHLRGPIMKIGQALSMQTHALGPEWIEELSRLQMQAPAMHESLMRAQFKTALGKYPEEVFRTFEPEPFAAASLGQVHWATTKKGEAVAVKVQYPAIREAIENDFKLLRTAGFAARLSGHLPESIVREAQRGFLEETDYGQEARNIEHFAKGLAPLPFILMPKVYRESSCEQVLTMSRVPGLRMREFLETNPSPEIRDKIGAGLVRLFFFQMFRLGALHADPHPGNYLFNPDGSIGLIDFGCVKYLKPEVVRGYGHFWSRSWHHNKEAYAELLSAAFGGKKAAKDARVRRSMEEISRFYDDFYPLVENPPLRDCGDPQLMERVTHLAKVILRNRLFSSDFLFLSRTESGMINLLHMLKARVPTLQIAREFIPAAKARECGKGGEEDDRKTRAAKTQPS